MTPQEAIGQLQNIGTVSAQAMKQAELIIANEIAVTAIGLAPEDTAQLVGSIGVGQDEIGTDVHVAAPYSGYVEFGTGPYAKSYVEGLPSEWQEEAFKFFVSGKGHTQAHPFFYPAVLQHQQELLPTLEKELDKLLK